MQIDVAKSTGFCFGVKRALKIAHDAAKAKRQVYMLGDIVHNENVVSDIKKAGIKKIKTLTDGNGKILLIRAHGAPIKTYQKAKQIGYAIIDATCPMVKEIHKIVKKEEQEGYAIIVIGDKNHDEVQGIVGQLKNKAIVIDKLENIPLKKIKAIKKASIVVQSTQNIVKVLEIYNLLKKHIDELNFFNTICQPTRNKQNEIRRLPLENKVMLIIGSKTSANTKRLYEISKSLNKKSYWIQSKDEIKLEWFKNAKSVGITAGASTPGYTTQSVIKHIRKIS